VYASPGLVALCTPLPVPPSCAPTLVLASCSSCRVGQATVKSCQCILSGVPVHPVSSFFFLLASFFFLVYMQQSGLLSASTHTHTHTHTLLSMAHWHIRVHIYCIVVYMCICIYVYTHMYIYTYMKAYAYMCIHTCIHMLA